ncbi:hypothetical protein VOLCADRAFT_103040 [Volvox carteri f. nagariensis]|uniref:UDENN domain-containing protein n=1 Tax=Volvox carteri f. nagariensis TaxID=3068 RepID=D8TJJ1_VOLCA|nr:uncharacterized protein VOLCADRAFT_103040 [Volvox carteri f. nagariensis]EFJ52381.1 hypothetical protein VOLCADRAFT_103040 [Volvox carteri f. nagariensis]|eukprot:XP_002946454.1 hypothetical protein VOLCADRAFT_103040 [Volvox carteri f. nagariensis]
MRQRTPCVLLCLLLIASGSLLASAAKRSKGKKGNTAVSTFEQDGKKWTIYKNEEGRAFFFDHSAGKAQWTDPRITPLTPNQRTLALLVFCVPLVLMVAGAAGYLYWIKKTRPDLFKGPKKVKGLKNWTPRRASNSLALDQWPFHKLPLGCVTGWVLAVDCVFLVFDGNVTRGARGSVRERSRRTGRVGQKEVERPEPAGPSINPEALTAQKREWIDSQAAQGQQTLATWPEHLFEHFFVVGLPPDIEITRIAEDLWAQEVRQRQDGGEQHGGAAGAAAAAAVAGVVDGAGGGGSSVAGGSGRGGSKSQQQYDKAPRPAYDAQVLFRHPANKIAPLSDQELVDMCFPHKVTPVKLRRSPSLSSLHEVVYGRNAAARDDQCFIFLLKVGTNLPLYGICCAVPEVLHRPPHLARHMFPACRMPFRSVMIAAPRVYCLLSHYPFFDLHFQVLNVILGMERLHRTIDFNAELDGSGAAAAAAAQSSTAAGGGGGGVAGTPVAAAGGGDATAKVPHQPPPQQPPPQQHTQQPPQQPQTPQQQQRQPPRGAVRLSSRCYCQDCANAIVDMYPGLLQPWELDPLRPSRPGRPSLTGRLLSADDPWVTPVAAAAVAGRGAPLEAVPGGAALAAIRTQGSVRRLSDPGSAGFLSPRLDSGTLPVAPSELVAAGEQRQSRRLLGASGACSVLAVPSPAGPWVSNTASALASMHGLAAMESCQEEEGNAPEQGLLEHSLPIYFLLYSLLPSEHSDVEAAGALESALDKLAGLPRAVATSMNEAAAAAAVVLRRVSPGPGTAAAAAAASGGGTRPKAGTPSGGAAGRGGGGGSGDGSGDGAGQLPCLDSDSYLSSDMGTPHAAANSSAMAARALVATPAEAVSAFATIVRDSLKAIGSSAISTGRRRRSVGDGVCGASDGGASAAAAAAEQPDGLHIRRVGPDQSAAAFINVHLSSPLKSSRKLIQHLAAAVSGGGTAAPAAAAPPQLPPPLATKPTALLAWNSSAVTVAGGPVDGTAAAGAGGLASDASVSLVQQLMRSVMVPVSPVQALPNPAYRAPKNLAVRSKSPRYLINIIININISSSSINSWCTTEQGPGVWSCVGASEGDGAPSPAAAAVLAAAPHLLLAEHSGFSVNPSDASFYSADGVEEECTPRAAGPAERQALQPSFTTYTPSVLQPPGGLASGSSPPVGGWRFSVDLPPMSYSGGGAVVTRPRSAAFVPLLPGSRSSPAGAASGGGGGSGGGAAYGGSVLPLPSGLATAAAAALPGPSRLARTSAPLTQEGAGPRSNAAAAASAAAPVTGTATAAISPQLSASTSAMALLPRARSGGGAAAAGCCQPGGTPAPGQSSHGTSSGGGVVSPPPAGVSVTSSDMSHHFSPRHALDQLYGYPPVHPGEQMTLRFGGVATLQYTRPVLGRRFTVLGPPRSIQSYAEAELAEGLQHWTSSMLCRSLSLDKLLLVLTAVLLERQVVVFCPHISVLTGCVLGLLPLLRPFCWQSLMLPVTPASMMGFLEAPVPFVLGVQYKTSDVMARCSHLIRVNVYKDQVKNGGPSLPQLPGLKKLSAALAPHHALLRRRVLAHPGGGGGVGGGAAGGGGGGGGGGGAGVAGPALPLGMLLAGNQAAAAAESAAAGGRSLRAMSSAELSAASSFLSILSHHLIGLCGDLRPHVITNVGLSKRTGVLMKESLLEVIPPRDKPFVRQFVETQMFSVWSDALISANFEGSFAAATNTGQAGWSSAYSLMILLKLVVSAVVSAVVVVAEGA